MERVLGIGGYDAPQLRAKGADVAEGTQDPDRGALGPWKTLVAFATRARSSMVRAADS
jgi:hypothetical protein